MVVLRCHSEPLGVGMKLYRSRAAALGSASVVALCAGLAQPALAQDKPGIYLSLEGSVLMSGGTSEVLPSSTTGVGSDLSVNPGGDGAGGRITLGYRMNPAWDFSASAEGNWLDTDSAARGGRGPFFGEISSKANYYLADFDAGYTVRLGEATKVRLSGGIEYANFTNRQTTAYSYGPFDGTQNVTSRFWGIGPKLGLDASYRLGRSDFSVVGGVSGSVLFGQLHNTGSQAYYSYGSPNGKSVFDDGSKSHTAYGLSADLGLAYQLPYANFNSSITAGYRVAQWWNIGQFQPVNSPTGAWQDVDLLVHGPFLNWTMAF
ncbi:MAG: hypothetical protein QOK29_4203 [Rhodospirillaceae bacterium]|nr:hypothetical protein [Rhodospirillaceae bacterium]